MPNELELQPSATGQLKYVSSRPLTGKAVAEEIEKALYRVEQIDTNRITVTIEDNCVVLRGDVKSWREHEAAAKAAAGIAGVTRVQNDLRVAPWMF